MNSLNINLKGKKEKKIREKKTGSLFSRQISPSRIQWVICISTRHTRWREIERNRLKERERESTLQPWKEKRLSTFDMAIRSPFDRDRDRDSIPFKFTAKSIKSTKKDQLPNSILRDDASHQTDRPSVRPSNNAQNTPENVDVSGILMGSESNCEKPPLMNDRR